MRKTSNYGLVLYDLEDKMTITSEEDSINATMEIIDSTLKEKASMEEVENYVENNTPTKLSELENDSNFITKDVNDLSNYYNSTYIDETIGDIESLLGGI